MKYIDFHIHTQFSDGTATPEQVATDAASLGMEVISITDHDHTAGYLLAKQEASKWGVHVITGTEISTSKYHILGYDFDIENKYLQETLARSRNLQEGIVKKRIEKLRAMDIPITFEKVKNFYPCSRIGKLNLLFSIIKDADCRQIIGFDDSTRIFERYLSKGAFAGDVKIGLKEELSPKEAIDAIHAAGGLAVIAHPFKDVDDVKELDELVKLGLDGLEVQPNYGAKNDFFKDYAQKKGLIITYGSDFHGARLHKRPLLARGENLIKPFWKLP